MNRWLAICVALALTACTRANPDLPGAGLGMVRAQITQVPPTITCVQLVATIDGHSQPTNFDVIPGTPATLQIADLPVGELTFTAWAYGATCPTIGGQQATWSSKPTPATVRAGEVTPLSLTLEPVGGVDIGINFGSDGGADLGPPADLSTPPDLSTPADLSPLADLSPSTPDLACSCGAGQLCCAGRCVDPTSDPNHCGGCGQTCASGRCGATVAGGVPGDWSFNGSAYYNASAGSMMLTTATKSQAGTVVYRNPIRTGNFDVQFDFRITPSPLSFQADGIAFMIEKEGPTALGSGGSSMGVAGLTGYGFELDTFNNMNPATGTGGCGDIAFNHTSVDRLTVCRDYNGNALPTTISASPNLSLFVDGLRLHDGVWHGCSVSVTNGLASITIDGIARLSAVPLTDFVSGEDYYFGFGAGTGDSYSTQEVRNPVVTFPVAQCL